MDMTVIVRQLVVLFITLAVGYVGIKRHVIRQSFAEGLADFVIKITLPCMMIASVLNTTVQVSTSDTLRIALFSALAYGLAVPVGYLTARALGYAPRDRGLIMYMMTFPNVGFMGFPVMHAIFGPDALIYTVIANIVFNIMNFTLGIALIKMSSPDAAMKRKGSPRDRYDWLLKPGVVASILALILYFLKLPIPDVLVETVDLIGSATTPLAMLFIGMSLAKIPLRRVFSDWRLYPFAAVQLIVYPLLMMLLYRVLPGNALEGGVLTMLVAMPVATTGVLFAQTHDANLELATKGTFMTTLLSLLSIPVLVWAMWWLP